MGIAMVELVEPFTLKGQRIFTPFEFPSCSFTDLEHEGSNIGRALKGPIRRCSMTRGSDCTVKLRPVMVYGQLVCLPSVITSKVGLPWSEGPLDYRGKGRPAWRNHITVGGINPYNEHLIITTAR
uniref:Uncharacterized protein n=1 Tax=Knipowitschia caucasica TaxID=637954 RepID=A0AAV2LL48_KNICA